MSTNIPYVLRQHDLTAAAVGDDHYGPVASTRAVAGGIVLDGTVPPDGTLFVAAYQVDTNGGVFGVPVIDYSNDFVQYGNPTSSPFVASAGLLLSDPFDVLVTRAQACTAQCQGEYDNAFGAALVAMQGNWSMYDTPAVNLDASLSRAGVAFQSHVCTSISVGLIGTGAPVPITITLRDGAIGLGAILWQLRVPMASGSNGVAVFENLSIVGTQGNAMSLEVTGNPGGGAYVSEALTGYTAGA